MTQDNEIKADYIGKQEDVFLGSRNAASFWSITQYYDLRAIG